MVKPLIGVAALLLALSPHWGMAAGTPSITASVSGYYALGSGFIPESEWLHIPIVRNDRPGHVEASGSGGDFFTSCPIPCVYGPGLTSASVQGFASAEPGVLRVFASDMAIASPTLNAPNVPATANSSSVYTQISAAASFTDYLRVGVAGKAVGTPVQVPLRFLAEMVGSPGLGYPQWSAHPISVYVRFDIPGYGPQIFSSESNPYYFAQTPLPNGNVLYGIHSTEILIDAKVGDELEIRGSIGISGTARIVPGHTYFGNSPFGAFLDARNTAGIRLGELPAGMTITSASGHDYRLDPSAIAVPEPASAALLLAGLGLTGLAARRRRGRAAPVRIAQAGQRRPGRLPAVQRFCKRL